MFPTTVIGTNIHGNRSDFVTYRSLSCDFVEAVRELQTSTGALFDVYTLIVVTEGDAGEQIYNYWSGTSEQFFLTFDDPSHSVLQ